MFYQNTKRKVRLQDTDFFNITAGFLQGDTLAPYQFIICLDYILEKAVDFNVDLGFTLTKQSSRPYSTVKITDLDYAVYQ